MADIFISYAHEDGTIANAFHNRLTEAGLSVFRDAISLAPGSQWSQKIREELKAARMVLVLASQTAMQSDWVKQESAAAALAGKRVIPVVWNIEPTQLPGWLHEYQALDLRGQDARQIQTRVETFVQQLVREKQQLQIIVAVGLVGLAAIAIFTK